MTQTNDSELERVQKNFRDGHINVFEAIQESFTAGENSGIAKAEKCVPERTDWLDHNGFNTCRQKMLNNLAKLKNL